jgi:hypothetical protein
MKLCGPTVDMLAQLDPNLSTTYVVHEIYCDPKLLPVKAMFGKIHD